MMIIHQDDFSGNERQLKILTKAIRENSIISWNNFVKRSGTGFKADLKGINLSDFNLKEINLSHADLSHADFTGSDLRRANLSGARLSHVSFHSANLQHCKLNNCDLRDSKFTKSDIRNANLSNSKIKNANFFQSIYQDADFSGTDIKSLNLNDINLEEIKTSKNIKMKVKATGENTIITEKIESPWIVAQNEEDTRKELRLVEEKIKKKKEKEDLKRKLGVKTEKWKKV